MILLTHAIAGAALGRLTPKNLFISFSLGFVSHFILDAIPHKTYSLKSYQRNSKDPMKNDMAFNKNFIRDLFFMALDLGLGFIISVYFFQGAKGFFNPSWPLIFGALGGVTPDALQFLYFKFRKEPLLSLQKFHNFIDSETSSVFIGYLTQLIVIIILVSLSKILGP